MWLLQGSEATAGKVHYLVCGQALVIGRRDGHILLTNDVSISRKHASFTLTFPPVNLKTREAAKVELRDLDSKYGTFINENIEKGERLSPGVAQKLHHGDLIRFGIFANTWRLEHQDLTVSTSTLKSEGRQQLINALVILGGHLQNDWSSDCCYLVMPAITLTVKVACALAAGRSIVLPEFFTKLADAIIQKNTHPNPAQFLPPVLELKISSAGASFSPDPRRSTIFAGLTFLFPTQAQMTRMCSPVHLAGGKVELLTEDNFQEVVSGKFLLISLSTESQQTNTLYSRTNNILKEHGLRTVPEAEIGLAILFVSTEGHCNSSFKHSDIFKRSSSTSQPSEKLKIFATETQATEFSVSLTGSKVVPESGGRQQTTTAQNEMAPPRVPSKRPLTASNDGGGKAKRSNRAPSPDLTEPLSTLDLCDEDNEEEGIKMEVNENTFKPEHTSTQRNDPPPSTSVDQSATVSFAPYTLPSLKTLEPEEEEEEQTQPFCPDKPQEDLLHEEDRGMVVKKEEPKVKPKCGKDLKFDEWWKGDKEEEDLGRKRTRSEETSPQVQETKKTKTDNSSNKSNTSSNNDCDNDNGSSNKRKATDNDENIFALPPRARQRERTVENLKCKPTADSDLFALPARTQRPRRLHVHQDSTLVPPTLPSPTQDTPVIPPTPESKSDVTSMKEDLTSSKFIDREEITTLKNSADTGELTVSRTLVVVEPMVKPQPSPLQCPPAKSHDTSCLPNFKIFKKVSATCILKVIGGSDFVENDQTPASQEFKIEVEVSKNNNSRQERQPTFDEELFNLGGPTRRRR